jgi:hypothetical protein
VATTREIYEQTIRPLPRQERRELADLILADLAQLDEMEPRAEDTRSAALELLESLPGQRLFKTAEDADAYLEKERNSWGR